MSSSTSDSDSGASDSDEFAHTTIVPAMRADFQRDHDAAAAAATARNLSGVSQFDPDESAKNFAAAAANDIKIANAKTSCSIAAATTTTIIEKEN